MKTRLTLLMTLALFSWLPQSASAQADSNDGEARTKVQKTAADKAAADKAAADKLRKAQIEANKGKAKQKDVEAGDYGLGPAVFAVMFNKDQRVARADFGTRRAELALGLEAHAVYTMVTEYGVDGDGDGILKGAEITKTKGWGVGIFVGAFGLEDAALSDAGLITGPIISLIKVSPTKTISAINLGWGLFIQGGRDVVVKSDEMVQSQKTRKKTVYGHAFVLSVNLGF